MNRGVVMREQEQSRPKAGLESGQNVLEDWAVDEGTQKLHPN